MKRYGLLSIIIFVASCASPTVEYSKANATFQGEASSKHPVAVLFVGNSYLYYNDSLHNHVRRIVEELHPELVGELSYKSATIGGARLQHHNISWLLDPQLIGTRKPFEVVILQGGSTEVLEPNRQLIYQRKVVEFSAIIRAAGATPMLYMTPAYVPPHRLAEPGLIETIVPATYAAAEAASIDVIPVGEAFAEAYRRRPALSLHKAFDGTHPNIYGTYLAACVVYLSVYGNALEDLRYDYFGEIEPDVARFLRAVAFSVTQANLIDSSK